MEELRLWAPIILSIVGIVYTIMSTRGKAKDERVKAIEDDVASLKVEKVSSVPFQAIVGKVDIVEDRVSRLEGEMQHLPTRQQTHELALALREMKGEIGILTEKLKPISATTERLQDFLIDEATSRRGVA